MFSGLAFAALVVALIMQRDELRLQREELQLQRADLKDTQQLIESQAKSMKQQVAIAQGQEDRASWLNNPKVYVKVEYDEINTGNAPVIAISLQVSVINISPVPAYIEKLAFKDRQGQATEMQKLEPGPIAYGDSRTTKNMLMVENFPIKALYAVAKDGNQWDLDDYKLESLNKKVGAIAPG